MMRIRQEGDPLTSGATMGYSPPKGVCFTGTTLEVSAPDNWKVISDKKNLKKDDRYPSSPVLHYSRECKPDDKCFHDGGLNVKRWGRTFFKAINFVWIRNKDHALVQGPIGAVPPNWDADFPLKAIKSITPRIRPAIQAPVEILELVTGWRSLLKPDLLSDFVKGDIVKGTSKGNLWYQFGVAPLIGSIKDTKARLKTFDKDLRAFVSHQGKPQKGFYREKFTITSTEEEVGVYDGSRMTPVSHKGTHTAVAIYRYTIPGIKNLSKDVRRLLALADMFDLGSPVGWAWELTPYSFVVDWFLSVGDWLSQFDKPFLDVDIVFDDFCVSSSQQREATISWLSKAGTWCADVGKLHEELYWRSPWVPSTEWFGIEAQGPLSVRKMLLGASLVGVRLK